MGEKEGGKCGTKSEDLRRRRNNFDPGGERKAEREEKTKRKMRRKKRRMRVRKG